MARQIGIVFNVIGALVTAVNLVGWVTEADAQKKSVFVCKAPMPASRKTIEDSINAKEDLSTFLRAMKAAGLVQLLGGPGPVTVFAPTDLAFANLSIKSTENFFAQGIENLLAQGNKSTLKQILSYHVVRGVFRASDLSKVRFLTTVEGETLVVSSLDGKIALLDSRGDLAAVDVSDAARSNGVVYNVNRVMVPRVVLPRSGNTRAPLQAEAPLVDFFPWPPVTPTASYPYKKYVFFNKSELTTLDALSEKIDDALDRHGYSDRYYFAQRSGSGFVVLTRTERITDGGKSSDHDRWTTDVKLSGEFSISDYLKALVGKHSGRFRVFALVVTKDPQGPSKEVVTSELLQRWRSQGQPKLPKGYEKIPLTEDYDFYALVYEFSRSLDSEETTFVRESSLSALEHLKGAGLAPGDFK
jgi:uncharacterized surface protein with fasciclin (FAS1) repeats